MLERPETWGQQLVEIMIQWQGGVRSLPLYSMALHGTLHSQVPQPTIRYCMVNTSSWLNLNHLVTTAALSWNDGGWAIEGIG